MYEDQTGYAPKVMDMVGASYVHTDQLELAKEKLAQMRSAYSDSPYISKLSLTIYKDLAEMRKQQLRVRQTTVGP